MIEPRYEGAPKPKLFEILKCLPKTNCRECGESTCMVFAALMALGVKVPKDCPQLLEAHRRKLENYMKAFLLDD